MIIYVRILFAILLLFIACSNKPDSLQECYYELDNMFSTSEKENIIKSNSADIMIEYHMNIGMFIRNEWIRHGNSSLLKNINYNNWSVGIDDISGVILDGYWHYLHNIKYDWSQRLNNAEIYYKSCEIPDTNNIPFKTIIEKLNYNYFYVENNITYTVHLYKILHSNNYYLYIYSKGWRKIDKNKYDLLNNVKTRDNITKSIYNK